MGFARRLQEIRKERGLSQEELAGRVGISRQAVAKWEAGESSPDIANLLSLRRILGLGLDSLLAEDEACPVGARGGTAPDPDGFLEFLLRAKKASYAGKGPEVAPSRPASHDLSFAEGGLLYIDSWLGGGSFAGEEAVWREGVAIWSMNYCGRTLGGGFSGDFLKEALSLVTPESPYRGPSLHQKGELAYHCAVEGDPAWFKGEEYMYRRGIKVYECRFHGGSLGA